MVRDHDIMGADPYMLVHDIICRHEPRGRRATSEGTWGKETIGRDTLDRCRT